MDDMKVTERIQVGISEFLSSLVNLDVSARNLAQVKGWVESAQEKADNAEKMAAATATMHTAGQIITVTQNADMTNRVLDSLKELDDSKHREKEEHIQHWSVQHAHNMAVEELTLALIAYRGELDLPPITETLGIYPAEAERQKELVDSERTG